MAPVRHQASAQVGLGPFVLPSGRFVRAALRDASTTIGLDDIQALSFDAAGLLIRAFWERRSVRRSLDNRFIERRRVGPFPWSVERRELARAEWHALLGRIHEELAAVRDGIDAAGCGAPRGRLAELKYRMTEILGWTPAALEAHAARFRSVYGAIPILPPDQYGAVVVQVTEGCAYNRCAFCQLYRDRPYRAKTLDDVRDHIRAIRDLFGAALPTRRGVFLADANALMLPPAHLTAALDLVREAFARHNTGSRPVYSFVDALRETPSPEHIRTLADRGLRRVYLGLETGCDELLAVLNKPATRAGALALVRALKAGGVAVGVIVLVGVGGPRYAGRHVAETLEALDAMTLGPEDMVYLSPLAVEAGSRYERWAREEGGCALADDEMDGQLHTLERGIRRDTRGWPKVAVYDVRDFIY